MPRETTNTGYDDMNLILLALTHDDENYYTAEPLGSECPRQLCHLFGLLLTSLRSFPDVRVSLRVAVAIDCHLAAFLSQRNLLMLTQFCKVSPQQFGHIPRRLAS